MRVFSGLIQPEVTNSRRLYEERLPDVRLTILNDVSAAAWRYKDEGRFCLITVSSGLSDKVFNSDLRTPDKLDLDAAGISGEMSHVIVEPRAVDALVRYSIMQVTAHPEEFTIEYPCIWKCLEE